MKRTVDAVCAAAARRRNVLYLLGVGALTLALPQRLGAEEAGGGGSGGGSGSGGHEGGGSGSGNKGGKTPAQRAVQHRQRTGRTLGGGESHGGETGDNHGDGGGSGEGESTEAPPLSEGSTTGPIGGESGGEHFIHQGQGGWGADTKVLRDN